MSTGVTDVLDLKTLATQLENQRRADEGGWLQETLSLSQPLPRAGGYGAAEDFLALLVRLIRAQAARGTAPRVLELGSGLTSLISALTLAQLGAGSLLSLEHDQRFLERTRRWLADFGADDAGEIWHAPLQPCPPETGASSWYDDTVLPEKGEFDLLIVDGPPAWHSPGARAPALPMLNQRLAEDALIVVDDYRRRGERRCVQRWQGQFPRLQLAEYHSRKGTAILRW